ncbi:MAG: SMC-Scp complex subunit ScpB [Acidobacteriia bacterium]|nr:SMC-Scp complex subunit ScpB [Terriglobia bacterium]
MLSDEALKAVIEAIIYVAPEPVSLDAIVKTLEGEERDRVRAKLEELLADYEQPQHGIQIRPVPGGYKFSSKAAHHDVPRQYVKSLKPALRLSKPALETLAVIAYRQPVTVPEINEIRGVDCGGVIHTLMERKLVVTSGRKNVVGRPILYRTSRDFLVHFGLKDVGELPSLKEFEELARQAMGPEWAAAEVALNPRGEPAPASPPAPGEEGPEPAPVVEVAPASEAGSPEAAPAEEATPEPAAANPEPAPVGEATPEPEAGSQEATPAEGATSEVGADNPEEV